MNMIWKALLALALCASFAAHAQAAAPTATVQWDAYAPSDVTLFGVTGYRVEQSIQPIGTTCTNLLTYTVAGTTGVTVTTYTATAASLGKRYCFQARGVNSIDVSGPSNAAGKDFPLVVPPAPTNLRVN